MEVMFMTGNSGDNTYYNAGIVQQAGNSVIYP